MVAFDLIDDWLKENKMSRRKLAIAANIPPSTLQSAFERRNSVSLDWLIPVSIETGILLEDLVRDVPELYNQVCLDEFSAGGASYFESLLKRLGYMPELTQDGWKLTKHGEEKIITEERMEEIRKQAEQYLDFLISKEHE